MYMHTTFEEELVFGHRDSYCDERTECRWLALQQQKAKIIPFIVDGWPHPSPAPRPVCSRACTRGGPGESSKHRPERLGIRRMRLTMSPHIVRAEMGKWQLDLCAILLFPVCYSREPGPEGRGDASLKGHRVDYIIDARPYIARAAAECHQGFLCEREGNPRYH
jgi:hypothetical protein